MAFRIIEAATVVCLRRVADPAKRTAIRQEEIIKKKPGPDANSIFMRQLFQKNNGVIKIQSDWQVLMGQSEVKNWYKSTPNRDVMMRYGGEYKFAGGAVDAGDGTVEAAARREMGEEFLVDVPAAAKLHLFNVKQTKPIRGKSYLMHNFVCLEEENPWLASIDTANINDKLAVRRADFMDTLSRGKFCLLSPEQKSKICPEVHQVAWLPVGDAIFATLSSKSDVFQAVNAYQQEEFLKYGIVIRDPMFQTVATLFELASLPTPESLLAKCRSLPPLAKLQKSVKKKFMVNRHAFAEEDAQRIQQEKLRRQRSKL